jgi:NADPH:quinone reductase-like Zn-dependent oxidoreductase
MGGLGRQIPGSYAQYVCVTETNVRPIPPTNLSIDVLASLPEMLQTTWGSLVQGLDLKAGESLLVRGGTSSIGICAIQMARRIGASRIGATTRSKERQQMLRDFGADEVFIDNAELAGQVRESGKGLFSKVLELVGATTVRDSLKCVVARGTVCMTGIQGGGWDLKDFSLFGDMPNRARLCVYGGGPADFLMMPWEALVRDVEAGGIRVPVKSFELDEIQKVHEILEQGGGGTKMVVVVTVDS